MNTIISGLFMSGKKFQAPQLCKNPGLYGPGDVRKEGITDFVGVFIDDSYGVVAFDFKSAHGMLETKKS